MDPLIEAESAISSIGERIRAAANQLATLSDTPRLDAQILMAHALGISRAKLLASLPERIEAPLFGELLRRRLQYEPLAYILGEWEFFSLSFIVRPPLLVPRPETEHLVEKVIEFINERPAAVLEIGTGTGCIAVAVARNAPSVRIIATDINPVAVEMAALNAERHHVADRLEFRCGDLYDALGEPAGPFDAICSNPPYVEEACWNELSPVIRLHEDPGALLSGADGLDLIRRIVVGAPARLKPGGLLALEIGQGQSASVMALLREAGFEEVGFVPDLAGIERVVHGRKPMPRECQRA